MTLWARYRAARRAPWWLRSNPRVTVERLFFEEGGDPVVVDSDGGRPA